MRSIVAATAVSVPVSTVRRTTNKYYQSVGLAIL